MLLHPASPYPGMTSLDLPVMLIFSFLVIPMAFRGRDISRLEGGILLAAYGVFLAVAI